MSSIDNIVLTVILEKSINFQNHDLKQPLKLFKYFKALTLDITNSRLCN